MPGLDTRLVGAGMDGPAAQRRDVFSECLLGVDQATLARTKAPEFKGRERYGVVWLHHTWVSSACS